MDEIDRRLLRHLASDGRATLQQLADTAGCSASSVARRQKALEDQGIIGQYAAIPDLARLGHGITALVLVTLDAQVDNSFEQFEAAVQTCPAILSVVLMSGRADYLVTLAVPSLSDYEDIHRNHLARLPHVARLETSFALRSVSRRLLPVGF